MAGDPFVIQSLAAYAIRIGAEQLNFKKYMVKTWIDVYYTEKVYIEIDSAGEVAVSAFVLAQLGEESEALNRLREGEHLLERAAARGFSGGGRSWAWLGRACLLLNQMVGGKMPLP